VYASVLFVWSGRHNAVHCFTSQVIMETSRGSQHLLCCCAVKRDDFGSGQGLIDGWIYGFVFYQLTALLAEMCFYHIG